MPGPSIAGTFFKSGPDDTLAIVDVYNTPAAAPPPVAPQQTNAAAAQQAAIQQNNQSGTMSALKASIAAGPTTTPPTTASLTSRLQSASGGLQSPLNSITGKLKATLLTAMGEAGKIPGIKPGIPGGGNLAGQSLLSQNNSLLTFTNGSTTSSVSLTDEVLGTANGLAALANAVTNGTLVKMIDIEAQHAVLSTIIATASNLGLIGLAEAVIGTITAVEDQIRVLLDTLRESVIATDLTVLALALSLAGATRILAKIPDIVYLLLSNFKLPNGISPLLYTPIVIQLKSLLYQLDPNWQYYTRNGQQVINLEPFLVSSNDALTLFRTDTSLVVPATIAANYGSVNIMNALRDQYPKVFFNQ